IFLKHACNTHALSAFPTRRSSDLNRVRTIEARAFAEKQSAISRFERRSFFKRLGLGGAALVPAAGWLASASTARADSGHHGLTRDRKSTRLNSSHQIISYAVFCLK